MVFVEKSSSPSKKKQLLPLQNKPFLTDIVGPLAIE
jgi:hypothetical protein